MFKRREKSVTSQSKLGLAISSPITTIKNNSEIIYISNPESMSPPDDDYVQLQSPFKNNYAVDKPLSPPDDSDFGDYNKSIHKKKRASDDSLTSRRPSYIPPTSSKVDELKLINYIDLSKSVSTVQMIATTGRLPPWLQRCTNLQYLVAKELGITIVDEWLSTSLTNLKLIRFNDNRIATWPDHLSRLMENGKLQVLDLEGNPCLTLMFKKSSAFKDMYIDAALSEDVKEDNGELPLKRTRSTSSSKSVHSSSYKPQSLFKKSIGNHYNSDELSEEEDDNDDDDMLTSLEPKAPPINSLRKHSSSTGLFSNFVHGRNLHILKSSKGKSESAPVSMFPSPELGTETPLPSEVKTINQHYTRTDVAKSKVVLAFLRDIYELSTKIVLQPGQQNSNKQFRTSSSSSTSSVVSYSSSRVNSVMNTPCTDVSFVLPQNHFRGNSIDTLQQYFDQFSVDNQANNRVIDVHSFIQRLQEFVDQEKQFVDKMNEFAQIYYLSKSKEAKKAAVLFKQFPEVRQLHQDVILRTFARSLEKLKSGEDNTLESFTSIALSILSSLELVYLSFAKGIESSKRQARFWLKLFRQSYATSSMYYGATYAGYVPTQHPDCDIGEWLRSCSKSKGHSLPSILDYLQLPMARLETIRTFFRTTTSLYPTLEPVFHRLETIYKQIQLVIPLEVRASRHADFRKLFKFPAESYGGYLCDANVVIQCKVSLNDVNISKGKTGDVMYQLSPTSEKNIPKYVQFDLNDPAHPAKGDWFRMVVFEEAVFVIHEAKKNVSRILLKSNVHASYVWPFNELSTTISTIDTNSILSKITTKSTSTSATSTGSSTPIPTSKLSLNRCFRLAIHDTSELWYLNIRTFTGDNLGGSLQETREELVNAITPQN